MTGPVPASAEYYPTPAWVVHRLLEALPLPGGDWLEPCVGDGHVVRAVDGFKPWADLGAKPHARWVTQDIRSTPSATHVGDYIKQRTPGAFDVGLTNPPFSKAVHFVRQMFTQCRHVAILQRLDWMGSAGRRNFFAQTRPDVYVLPEKVAFVDGQTDPANHYAWYHWHEGAGNGELYWLDETPASLRTESPPTEDPRQEALF